LYYIYIFNYSKNSFCNFAAKHRLVTSKSAMRYFFNIQTSTCGTMLWFFRHYTTIRATMLDSAPRSRMRLHEIWQRYFHRVDALSTKGTLSRVYVLYYMSISVKILGRLSKVALASGHRRGERGRRDDQDQHSTF
jgi:hypothetical protein